MPGRRTSAVTVPSDSLRVIALEALMRYADRGFLLPGDALLPVLVERFGG